MRLKKPKDEMIHEDAVSFAAALGIPLTDLNKKVSLYDIVRVIHDEESQKTFCSARSVFYNVTFYVVKFLVKLLKTREDAMIKVYWRTRWSSGPSEWEKISFNPSETEDGIKESLEEICYVDAQSEHYRGFDFKIVKTWDEDPSTV